MAPAAIAYPVLRRSSSRKLRPQRQFHLALQHRAFNTQGNSAMAEWKAAPLQKQAMPTGPLSSFLLSCTWSDADG